ncbi:MAG: hypothetical protein CMJ65_08045 [Planctomycetaceae bacterium]|nr:hypothetical protein [Planctomycetaceae bacterium]
MSDQQRSEWKRTLWGLIGVLLSVGAVGAAWVHHVWTHSDQLLDQVVREQLDDFAPGLTIDFSGCRFDLLRRVRIDNVTLSTSNQQPLASIPEVTVAIDRQALAKHQQLVIQSITLHRPRVLLSRDSQGQWNWQAVSSSKQLPATLPEWSIEQGRIEVSLEGETSHDRSLHDLDLKLVPSGTNRYLVAATAELDDKTTTPRDNGRQATTLSLNGHWQVTDSTTSLNGKITSLSLDRSLTDFVSEFLPADKDQAPRLIESLAGASFAGRGQVAFRLDRWQPGSDWNYKLLLDLSAGRLTLPGHPWQFSQIGGKVYCDPRHIQVKNLVAREGETTLAINALVHRRLRSDGRIDISIENIPLDSRFRNNLPPDWQTLFDTYSLAGRVDFTSTLRPSTDGDWLPGDSVITARGCRMRHARFPYPLRQLAGTLTQIGSTRNLQVDIEAFAGSRPATMRGLITNAGPTAESTIDIAVDRLPFDKTLLQAVTPTVRRTLESLGLNGAVDIRAQLKRPPGLNRKPTTHLAAGFVDAVVNYRGFAWPISQLSGTITATITPEGYTWQFDKLSGRHGTARLTGDGYLHGRSGAPGPFSLNIEANDINLDSQLRAACRPELRAVWNRIALRGLLNGRLEIRRQGRSPVRITIPRFVVRQGGLRDAGFPYELRDVHATGNYSVADDRSQQLVLTSLHGQHETVHVSSGVVFTIDPHRDWTLRFEPFSVDGLVSDKDLLTALPDKLRDLATHLNPQGPLQLAGLIELRGAKDPKIPMTAAWDLETRLAGNSLTTGVRLDEVTGRINSRGKWYGTHAIVNGDFQLKNVTLWDYRFTDVRGPFHLMDHDLVIGTSQAFTRQQSGKTQPTIPLSQHVTARAVGGLFTLDAQTRIDKQEADYHVKMNMSEAKLQDFARKYMRDPRKLKGTMRGWVDLRGRGQSPANVTGRGQLQVSPAELYELPIIVQLFDVLSLGPPEQTAFRYAQCDFQLARSRFHLNSIDLVGNSLQLRGRGQATFDGRVNLDFYSMLPRSRIPVPFLQPLLGSLTTGWVAVRVNGRTSNPQARVRAAPVLDDALKGFLGVLENPNQRRQLPPLRIPFTQPTAPRTSRQNLPTSPNRAARQRR